MIEAPSGMKFRGMASDWKKHILAKVKKVNSVPVKTVEFVEADGKYRVVMYHLENGERFAMNAHEPLDEVVHVVEDKDDNIGLEYERKSLFQYRLAELQQCVGGKLRIHARPGSPPETYAITSVALTGSDVVVSTGDGSNRNLAGITNGVPSRPGVTIQHTGFAAVNTITKRIWYFQATESRKAEGGGRVRHTSSGRRFHVGRRARSPGRSPSVGRRVRSPGSAGARRRRKS